ncbi:MAG: peroxiredoxin [Bacteroidales bacterium]|jgi:peroxiredoxin Q/BCP|nr:peroxiredoxin [Bacteroidales bacterium]
MKINIGQKAPDFELFDQSGNKLKLYNLLGTKSIVLFFYPKDNSPGCTREACAFRDSYEIFQEQDTVVIGISSDSEDSHKRFAEKQNLPYTLLSDKEGKVRKLFCVPKTMGFLPGRVTYIIDKRGIVRHIFKSQLNFKGHIEEVLNVLKSMD